MICPHCEFEIEDNMEICPYCQSFVKEVEVQTPKQEETRRNQKRDTEMPVDESFSDFFEPHMEQKEFWKLPQFNLQRKNIKTGAVIMYVVAAVNVLLGVFLQSIIGTLWVVDVSVIIGLTMGTHIAKNRVCAVLLVVYWAINAITKMIMMKGFGTTGVIGFAFVWGSFMMAQGVFHLHKQWKLYVDTGKMPENIAFPKMF